MNTAKEIIMKLIEEMPETKAGEVIDFLEYLKYKQEQELYMNEDEELELLDLIKKDEKIPSCDIDKLIEGK